MMEQSEVSRRRTLAFDKVHRAASHTQYSIHLLCRVVVLALERHTEEYAPPRLPVRPLALPRAFAAHEAHGLPVPVAQQIERDAARQLQHNAVVVEVQVVMAEVGGDEVLGCGKDINKTANAGAAAEADGILTSGPNTTSFRFASFAKCAFRCFLSLCHENDPRDLECVLCRSRDVSSAMGSAALGKWGRCWDSSVRVWCICGMVATKGEKAHGFDRDEKFSISVGSTYLGHGQET